MDTTGQEDKSRSSTWIWVVVSVAILCFCCVVVIIIVGGFYYLEKTGRLPWQLPSLEPTMSLPPEPRAEPTWSLPTEPPLSVPSPSGFPPFSIEPFDIRQSDYPTLQNLAEGWDSQSVPSTRTWYLDIPSTQPAFIFLGWCSTTRQILEQNYQHITWLVDIDNQPTPLSQFFQFDQDGSDMACRNYSGLIRRWPISEIEITLTLRIAQSINDGWDDYSQGDYTDTYVINITP